MTTPAEPKLYCPAKVACDGRPIRETQKMCGLCADAMKRRARQNRDKPLRGATTAEYMRDRSKR